MTRDFVHIMIFSLFVPPTAETPVFVCYKLIFSFLLTLEKRNTFGQIDVFTNSLCYHIDIHVNIFPKFQVIIFLSLYHYTNYLWQFYLNYNFLDFINSHICQFSQLNTMCKNGILCALSFQEETLSTTKINLCLCIGLLYMTCCTQTSFAQFSRRDTCGNRLTYY